MTDHPNNREVRRWAEAKGLPVQSTGRIPLGLVKAWDRAHPDRPYNKHEAHHGTWGGYSDRGCTCERCLDYGRTAYRERRVAVQADGEWDDDGAL